MDLQSALLDEECHLDARNTDNTYDVFVFLSELLLIRQDQFADCFAKPAQFVRQRLKTAVPEESRTAGTGHAAADLVAQGRHGLRPLGEVGQSPAAQGIGACRLEFLHRLMEGAHLPQVVVGCAVIAEEPALACLDNFEQLDLPWGARQGYPAMRAAVRLQDPGFHELGVDFR